MISRRQLLTALGPAAALAYGVLSSTRASAQTATRKRFVTFFSSSGVAQRVFWPTGSPGAASSGSYSVDGTSLASLKPLLGDIIIPKGITIDRGAGNAFNGGDAHDAGSVAILTGNYCRSTVSSTRPYAFNESLDRLLGRRLSTTTPERSLLFGTRLQIRRISKYISFDEQGQPIEPLQDPYVAYNRIFRNIVNTCAGDTTGSAELERIRARRGSVLDTMRAETERMKTAYGMDALERQKLEKMEESIRSIERRLDTTLVPSSARCGSIKTTMESSTPIANTDPNFPSTLKLQIDLIALAFELDITRVATVMLSLGGSGGTPMTWLNWTNADGVVQPITSGHHNTTHGTRNGVTDSGRKLPVIDRWNISQFAYLLTKLKEIQEGASNVLQNSIAWYASDCGEGSGHTLADMPFIIGGGAGGALNTGRYVQFNGAPRHQRLLLSFLQKLGIDDVTEFGRAGSMAGGGLL